VSRCTEDQLTADDLAELAEKLRAGSVLSAKAVLEIKRLLAEGGLTHREREIGARFHVSKPAITGIATGRTWAWLNEQEIAA
jgi:hypothetical protein